MHRPRLAPIVSFFRPEPAGSGNRDWTALQPSIPAHGSSWPASIKALGWVAVSVLTALAIGQLH